MATQVDRALSHDIPQLKRHDFPPGFIFGTSSASYQYEGGVMDRGKNIWDVFTTVQKHKIKDKSDGTVADMSYYMYEEDVKCMKAMGVDAYRFSISWSRIFPDGKRCNGINDKGVKYYNDLINMLLQNGVKPFVTLFHFDVPQALEHSYKGFLSHEIVQDFCDFADFCFDKFGDRVKHWITLNEPWSFSYCGYALGIQAPGRCTPGQSKCLINGSIPLMPHRTFISDEIHKIIEEGDSGTEPYIVTHNQLLAHAATVKRYKDKYQSVQRGTIGITLVSIWAIPYSESKDDREATQRQLDFMFGWFMDPLTSGQYPDSMKRLVGHRLPRFTPEESKMLIGSFDFLGLNYYTTYYVKNDPIVNGGKPSYVTDPHAKTTPYDKNGVPIGPQAGSEWLYVYPKGIWDLLLYTKNKYNNPLIYITENGVDEANDPTKTIEEACEDPNRIYYHAHHLDYVKKAIKDGVKVKGYFAWSLLDNFEWSEGYTVRFGFHYLAYFPRDKAMKLLPRYPKKSAKWFTNFLHNKENKGLLCG
ncbi:beta-glucosidase [Sarracenia purpurea var. burkii]